MERDCADGRAEPGTFALECGEHRPELAPGTGGWVTTVRPKQKLKKRYDRPIMLYMAYTVASEANFQREDGPLPMHVVEPAATRKTKGKPVLGEEEQMAMLTLRDALAEARLAEQRIWNEVKAQIRAAVEGGATYAAIGEALGITKARVYQLSSGKRSSGSRDSKLDSHLTCDACADVGCRPVA